MGTSMDLKHQAMLCKVGGHYYKQFGLEFVSNGQ